MKKQIFQVQTFLYFSLLALILAGFSLFSFDKKTLHLIINHTNSPIQDFFFKYITHLGDGLFAAAIVLVVLFVYKLRTFFIGLGCFAFSGLGSQLIKKGLFLGEPRPAKVFEGEVLHFVEGVHLNYVNSFPSGHTATAFALFLFLASLTKNKGLQLFYAIIACLVGYSRTYLSQHFVVDITFGAILGILSYFLSVALFQNSTKPVFDFELKNYFKGLRSKKANPPRA